MSEDPGLDRRPVRFGAFELDPRAGELRKAGARVSLQEQPFKVLECLLQRPGELITREELRQRLLVCSVHEELRITVPDDVVDPPHRVSRRGSP